MSSPATLTANDAVAAEFRAVMARQTLSARELAPRLGVAHTWVARRLRGDVPLSVDDVVRIAQALDVDPMPLLEHALTP